MKTLFSILLSLCYTLAFSQDEVVSMDSLFRAKAKQSIGRKFPAFFVKDGNKIFENDSLKGKVVFINFWFEACPPCIAELPSLNELYEQFKFNDRFVFLSFTFEPAQKIERLKKKFKQKYPVLPVSTQDCYRLNQNNSFPTSIILNEHGVISQVYIAGTTDKAAADHFIKNTVYKDLRALLKIADH